MKQRSSGTVVLVLSILAGLAAALLSVKFLDRAQDERTVLVAGQEIPAFTPLDSTMFKEAKRPRTGYPETDYITNAAELKGRYARTGLVSGTAVREAHLATSKGETASLAAKLTETKRPDTRALAIPVDNATSVGGTVQPGDLVDIIAAVKVERPNQSPLTYSKVIAREVPVLHRTEANNGGKSTVVVQVKLQEAEEITFVQLTGTIYLATNPFPDGNSSGQKPQTDTPGVSPESFLQRFTRR